ncbi:MAG: peptide deformylase [Eubacteriaceae bacterium]|nr:peptide deformylase [Eubacteriaceae bacterium]
MAIRNIVTEGDEILRKKCREVSEVTDRIRTTMEDMLDTMHSECGVGIAAPQVGVMRRMFIAEPEPGRVYFMINPEILEMEGSQWGAEGCLSVPGLIGDVERPERIKIKALDLDGNEQVYDFEGFDAVVMCHENDHLDGTLYTDKAQNIRVAEAPEEDEE